MMTFSLLTHGVATGQVSVQGSAEVVIIEDNAVYQNKLTGLRIRGTIPVTISRSAIYENGRAGIYADKDSQVTVTDCDVYDNGRAGVNINRARFTKVENSKLHGNKLAGVRVLAEGQGDTEPAEVTIIQSRIYSNEQAGIRALPEADGRVVLSVVGTDVYENQNAGIRVENHTSLTAKDNRIHDNGTAGIVAFESETPPKLDIYQNRVFSNHQAGIHVVNGITGSIGIRNNWIYDNLRSGIVCGLWSKPDVENLNLEVINNTVVSNGSSDQGAGIRNDSDGRVLIMNNIVAYNLSLIHI